MPRDRGAGWLLQQWLDKADLDMRLALFVAGDAAEKQGFGPILGFHCQQAAEKYLKAALTRADISFPKTHDLQLLAELAEPILGSLVLSPSDAAWLTTFGVEIRYPGDSPEVLPGDERRAIEIATKVKQAVLAALDA